jgi:hypothetical protein
MEGATFFVQVLPGQSCYITTVRFSGSSLLAAGNLTNVPVYLV